MMLMQLGIQFSAKSVEDSAALLKAMALVIEEMGEIEASKRMVATVLEVMTNEETTVAIAKEVTNELFSPIHELVKVKDKIAKISEETSEWLTKLQAETRTAMREEAIRAAAETKTTMEAMISVREECGRLREETSRLRVEL